MSSIDEKKSFSARLKQALMKAKHPISPTYISREFNHRYVGQPISVQSANNWLLGKAIPNQDKLLILSIWLNVSTQWLRFGDQNLDSLENSNLNEENLDLLLKINQLTENQRGIIINLIDEFNQH